MIQHGAYFQLLGNIYMTHAPLPTDEKQLALICHAVAIEELEAMRFVLQNFFERREDGYHNTKADEELNKSNEISCKRVIAGKKGADSRWQQDSKVMANATESMANAISGESQNDGHIHIHTHKPLEREGGDHEEEVLAIARLYPKIADPFHLSRDHVHHILGALARHDGKVLSGTRCFRASFDKWPRENLHFASSVEKFFSESEYLFDSSVWDRYIGKASSNGKQQTSAAVERVNRNRGNLIEALRSHVGERTGSDGGKR